MGDYGHELEFGVFVTPSNAQPQAVVELAALADRAGLDLVSFQDHPYQPRFLDTWTLLSYVAARTTRVRLAPNVLNLPLRPPAVVARAVASLDLLSGGRVELGIGAGGFWDAIEAMGGRRLKPGQSVAALEEAIDVIRALWDTSEQRGARFDGSYYRLDGAKRGPAPAHPVGIWIGAYKPRMLDLIGRKGDGWLPSLPYLRPGDLQAGNAAIDESAAGAGRDPAEIRRLLNLQRADDSPLSGPLATWTDELTRLALEDGIGTFVAMADDPAAIETFAGEVVPAVREQVAAARAGASDPGGRVPRTAEEADPAPTEADADYDRLGITPTPDDGSRLGADVPWDESTRPHRPHRPPSGSDVTYTDQGREAGLGPVIDRLGDEHLVIHHAIEDVDRALVHHINEPDDFDQLQTAIDLLTDTLLSHLSYEEHELVEPLARLGFYPNQL